MLSRLSQQSCSDACPQPSHAPRPARLAGWRWGVALVVLVGGGLLVFYGYERLLSLPGPDLPRLGEVPAFTLIERSGQPVTRADLLGKVWIANFLYTRCPSECPLMSHALAQLQDALAAERDVRLVSMTVDPEYDTPEVLTHYAQRFAAHPQRWLFLTGEKATLFRLAREGFYLGAVDPHDAGQFSTPPAAWRFARRLGQRLAPPPAFAHDGPHAPEETSQTITHSARFVLVDRQGDIRHYYNSLDSEDVRRVPRDVRRVLREH